MTDFKKKKKINYHNFRSIFMFHTLSNLRTGPYLINNNHIVQCRIHYKAVPLTKTNPLIGNIDRKSPYYL